MTSTAKVIKGRAPRRTRMALRIPTATTLVNSFSTATPLIPICSHETYWSNRNHFLVKPTLNPDTPSESLTILVSFKPRSTNSVYANICLPQIQELHNFMKPPDNSQLKAPGVGYLFSLAARIRHRLIPTHHLIERMSKSTNSSDLL